MGSEGPGVVLLFIIFGLFPAFVAWGEDLVSWAVRLIAGKRRR